jgi:hypothetical protein
LLVTLDDFKLVTSEAEVTEPMKESRTIYWIKIIDMRNIIEIDIPGSLGNVIQDMGRDPVTILIAGEFVGPDAKTSLEKLMGKYISENNKPMQFSSDMTAAVPEITKVMLDHFHFEEIAGHPDSYRYYMKLAEYKEPRPPHEEKAPDQDAQNEVAEEGEIDDIRGQVLDSQDKPMAGVKVKIKGPDREEEVTTDEQGYYELLDVPEGQYEITVEDEAFEGEKEVVEVKKGESKKAGSES